MLEAMYYGPVSILKNLLLLFLYLLYICILVFQINIFQFNSIPLILPSVISCKSPSCLKTWPIHRCFLCHEFSICLYSFILLELLVTFSGIHLAANLFHSSLYPRFKVFPSSSVCLRQRPRLCCIQCYTPDQTFHYSLL